MHDFSYYRLRELFVVIWEITVQQQQQQPFNGLFSRTTWVSRYQNGKTNLDFTGARDSEWQWHQLSWAICKSAPRSRQITMPVPHHSVFYRPDALPAAQPTASKHWRLIITVIDQKFWTWLIWGSLVQSVHTRLTESTVIECIVFVVCWCIHCWLFQVQWICPVFMPARCRQYPAAGESCSRHVACCHRYSGHFFVIVCGFYFFL